MTNTSKVKEIVAKLEQGVKDLFISGRYAEYLKTLSNLHKYSTRNIMLIHMQRADATFVAGYKAWQTKYRRHIKKGEKAMDILAPIPFTKREEKEKLDPDTKLPIIGEDGLPVIEYTERQLAKFTVVQVYDVLQTDGKAMPTMKLTQDLKGNVEQYAAFMDALRAVSPLPIMFEAMPENMDGECRFGDNIAIRAGMSEIQTVSALIHEITHAKLHDLSLLVDNEGNAVTKDRRTEEVEAESVSYAVCQYFGIETGANSFGYLAEWSNNRELKELNASLETIRKTAADLIDAIDGKFREIAKERDINFVIGEAQGELEETKLSTMEQAPVPVQKSDDDKKQTETTVEHSNYIRFAELFPQTASGEYSYLRLEAGGGFEPLSLEWIGENRISVMHTYTLNGDLCYDPMVVFEVNKEAGTMTAVEFEQSIPPLYQVVDEDGNGRSVDGNGREINVRRLQASINEFTEQWLKNISGQGYLPVIATMEIHDEDTRINFDADGNPITPESEKDAGKTEIFNETESDGNPSEPELTLPDPSISYSEMNLYGYAWKGILPLTQSRATELFDADHTVYLLYPDNTEAMIFDRSEIVNHDGIFGIEQSEWVTSPEYAATKAETKNREGSREAELLYGSGNKFGIYQIKDEAGLRDYRFVSTEELREQGLEVVRENYELVYAAAFDERIEQPKDVYPVLNKLYETFNISHPEDYTGRSVSVSDVIVLKYDNNISSHYVDNAGFTRLAGFLGDEKQPVLIVDKNLPDKVSNPPEVYFQYGNKPGDERPAVPKGKPSLMERLAENKIKAERQGQPDTQKPNEREV